MVKYYYIDSTFWDSFTKTGRYQGADGYNTLNTQTATENLDNVLNELRQDGYTLVTSDVVDWEVTEKAEPFPGSYTEQSQDFLNDYIDQAEQNGVISVDSTSYSQAILDNNVNRPGIVGGRFD